MKTVAKKIESKSRPKCITVWFNAWKYERSEQPLWSAFLSMVLSELEDVSEEVQIKSRLKELGLTVSTIAAELILRKTTGQGLADLKQLASNFQSRAKDFKTLRDQLNDAIKETLLKDPLRRERVVIFVDDLDRCLPESIVELFEAIKMFLDCERCVFILGFDKDQLRKAFDRRYSDGEPLGSRYIEKFIQLEFELPPKTPSQIAEFVKRVAPRQLQEDSMVVSIISRFIQPNPRKIVRWLNRVAFVQELFRATKTNGNGDRVEEPPTIVPVWVFIKSFFPEFAALVERDQSIFYLVVKRARGETNTTELERVKAITIDKILEDFLRSLDPGIVSDAALPEVIFQTKLTITESVSRLQPESLLQQIDKIQLEEVDTLGNELIATSRGKVMETAKLIAEQLPNIKDWKQYNSSKNRTFFLRKAISGSQTESERRALFEMTMGVLTSMTNQAYWDLGPSLLILLNDPSIRKKSVEEGHLDTYISAFSASYSWDAAGEFADILELFTNELSGNQVNQIAGAALANSQIHYSFRAQPVVGKILSKRKNVLDPELLQKLKTQGKIPIS